MEETMTTSQHAQRARDLLANETLATLPDPMRLDTPIQAVIPLTRPQDGVEPRPSPREKAVTEGDSPLRGDAELKETMAVLQAQIEQAERMRGIAQAVTEESVRDYKQPYQEWLQQQAKPNAVQSQRLAAASYQVGSAVDSGLLDEMCLETTTGIGAMRITGAQKQQQHNPMLHGAISVAESGPADPTSNSMATGQLPTALVEADREVNRVPGLSLIELERESIARAAAIGSVMESRGGTEEDRIPVLEVSSQLNNMAQIISLSQQVEDLRKRNRERQHRDNTFGIAEIHPSAGPPASGAPVQIDEGFVERATMPGAALRCEREEVCIDSGFVHRSGLNPSGTARSPQEVWWEEAQWAERERLALVAAEQADVELHRLMELRDSAPQAMSTIADQTHPDPEKKRLTKTARVASSVQKDCPPDPTFSSGPAANQYTVGSLRTQQQQQQQQQKQQVSPRRIVDHMQRLVSLPLVPPDEVARTRPGPVPPASSDRAMGETPFGALPKKRPLGWGAGALDRPALPHEAGDPHTWRTHGTLVSTPDGTVGPTSYDFEGAALRHPALSSYLASMSSLDRSTEEEARQIERYTEANRLEKDGIVGALAANDRQEALDQLEDTMAEAAQHAHALQAYTTPQQQHRTFDQMRVEMRRSDTMKTRSQGQWALDPGKPRTAPLHRAERLAGLLGCVAEAKGIRDKTAEIFKSKLENIGLGLR